MSEFISKETVDKLRQIDALTYFKNYRLDEIKRNGRNDYILKDHDSLHFSNGKWYWWSQGKGGKNAIDFLMTVENHTFIDACEILLTATKLSQPVRFVEKNYKSNFRLPKPDSNNGLIIKYLTEERKIDKDIVNFFINNKQIYQDKAYKNVVFVGYDNGSSEVCGLKEASDKITKVKLWVPIKLIAFLIQTKKVNHFVYLKLP